jgi:hypothetical protein
MSIKDKTEEISHFIRNDSQSFFNEGEKGGRSPPFSPLIYE